MMYRLPTVTEYFTLKYSNNPQEVLDAANDISGGSVKTLGDLINFITSYLSELETIRRNDPKLIVPYYPFGEKYECYFSCDTSDIKTVSEYTGLNFCEVYALDILVFWAYLHDAAVYTLRQTKDGREYLQNARDYQQTKPDRTALREIFGG